MKIISLLLLTVSLSSTANECKVSPNLLSAYYDFNQQTINNPEVKKSPTQLFELHRNNNRVLQRDVNQGVHDIWSNKGKRLSLNRAFQQYQHVIEYQPNELGYQPRWQDIFQLVTTPDLNTMTLVEQKNTGCQLEQHYVLNTNKSAYQLVWLPKLQLVKYFEITSGNQTRQWALTDYQTNVEKITSLFTEYDNNQSNPFRSWQQ
jgi:beta-mannanase